ncbi:hypothetical protein ACIBG8_54270 [Nonomuraea sp. NPDC050556]|uniref:hypothetical protein n=1 Tax=Nonomuraea sp. NPDC050556 TaxID=3364369 RepID=UPI0037A67298
MSTPILAAKQPLETVTQPGAGVRPYRGGLFDAATIVEGDGRWAMGIQYMSARCADADWVQGWCPSGTGDPTDKTSHVKGADDTGDGWVTQPDAFTVYELWQCNEVGWTLPERIAFNEDRLRGQEQLEAERAFCTINLQRGKAVGKPSGDTAVSLLHAIGSLEAYACQEYSNQAVIHLPRWVYPYMEDKYLVHGDYMHNGQPEGGTAGGLHTRLGTRLAFGGGYFGNAPDGTPVSGDIEFWAYVTGEVVIRRGAIHSANAFAYETNIRTVLSERTYLATTDCLLGAVAVDLDA